MVFQQVAETLGIHSRLQQMMGHFNDEITQRTLLITSILEPAPFAVELSCYGGLTTASTAPAIGQFGVSCSGRSFRIALQRNGAPVSDSIELLARTRGQTYSSS
jgi:hypothetical protein